MLDESALQCQYQEIQVTRVWRKETRVSHALTASHIKAWCDGIAIPELGAFLDGHFQKGYTYQRTLDYAKVFFSHFWRHDKGLLNVDPDILKASITASNASSDNWA